MFFRYFRDKESSMSLVASQNPPVCLTRQEKNFIMDALEKAGGIMDESVFSSCEGILGPKCINREHCQQIIGQVVEDFGSGFNL